MCTRHFHPRSLILLNLVLAQIAEEIQGQADPRDKEGKLMSLQTTKDYLDPRVAWTFKPFQSGRSEVYVGSLSQFVNRSYSQIA